MSDGLLIYGATGYTGGLLARAARQRGLTPVLAGRHAARLRALGSELDLPHRAAPLDGDLDGALAGVRVVLNAAGPFSRTALPLAAACLRRGAHYLDLSGEVLTIEAVRRLGADAARRQVTLMTGVGFDVVPSDCLAAHVAARLPGACRLYIGIAGMEVVSRGSVSTLIDQVGEGIRVRRDGAIVETAPGALERAFDYGGGHGDGASLAVSWGDVATAFYTTAIPNIETYCAATPVLRALLMGNRLFGGALRNPLGKRWLDFHAEMLPPGPDERQRRGRQLVIVAEAEDAAGGRARARMRTPEAYTLTAATGVAIAERVMAGDFEPGFQTPARVYGADFALSFAGVTREDLAS